MVSIITVINDKTIFSEWLGKSLSLQKDVEYQMVTIDNCGHEFKSLGTAYSEGVLKAYGEWLMFVHPDIRFENDHSLKSLMDAVNESHDINKNIGLWGVAGVLFGEERVVVTKIKHGPNKCDFGDRFGNDPFVICQTVDACCYIIKKDLLTQLGFCKELNGFHMLVEELCLRLGRNGYDVAVVPAEIWHRSGGASLDHTYYREFRKVLKLNKDVHTLNTTSISATNTVWGRGRLQFYRFRNRLHHMLIKK